MKHLLALFLTLTGFLTLAAAGSPLLDKLPQNTAGASYFNVKKLAQSEGFAKWAHSTFFSGAENLPDAGIEELLVFTTSKPKLINAAYLKLARPIDLAANLKKSRFQFTQGKIGGKNAFFVRNAMLCEELTVVEAEPCLYLLAGKRSAAETLLKMPQKTPQLVAAQVNQLAIADAPFWYVDTGLKLPVHTEKKRVRGNIRMCFDPFCDGATGKYRMVVECPDASSASQMAVLVPMVTGVVSGVLFSEDASLNDRVMAQISPQLKGSLFSLDADIPAALMRDIFHYFQTRDFIQMVQSAIDLANL